MTAFLSSEDKTSHLPPLWILPPDGFPTWPSELTRPLAGLLRGFTEYSAAS